MGRHSAGSLAPSAKPPVINLLASDGELLDQVVGFYHDSLAGHEPAMAYLASRGLDADELIKHFRLGFSDRRLGTELPHSRLKAGDKIRRQLQRLGILRGLCRAVNYVAHRAWPNSSSSLERNITNAFGVESHWVPDVRWRCPR